MTCTFLFKSTITTEETYPHSFEAKYVREVRANCENYKDEDELRDIIFKEAHDFEAIITKGLHPVSTTTEILGITFIHDMKNAEALDIAKLGIERI